MVFPVRLEAYVFCDCYEKGCLRRPPPNPELVKMLHCGDITCRARATPKEHAAFVEWRTHACRHVEGVVTGGRLGHRLPPKKVHEALSSHRRLFPIFFHKILGSKPSVSATHIPFWQVQKLQKELARLKSFHCADRKIDLELHCLRGHVKQLVRAALKFRKPIAI